MSENQDKNIFLKLVSIFWEPSACFEALKVKINWVDIVIPLLVVIIAGMFASSYITPIAVKERITRIENSERLPDEQKEIMIERMENQANSPMNYVGIIIINVVKLAVVAAVILFIANFLFGGELKYMTLLAVTAYINLVDLVNTAVKTPMIVSQETIKVYTSIALFLDESSSYFFRLMSQIDIFTVWKVILFSIATAVLLNKKATKTALPIAAVWLLYALGTATLAGLANF